MDHPRKRQEGNSTVAGIHQRDHYKKAAPQRMDRGFTRMIRMHLAPRHPVDPKATHRDEPERTVMMQRNPQLEGGRW